MVIAIKICFKKSEIKRLFPSLQACVYHQSLCGVNDQRVAGYREVKRA
jgi:hypothetical protein